MLVASSLAAGCGGSPRSSEKATPVATIGRLVPGTRPSGQAAFMGSVRRVRVGGITVGYRQFGNGPPLLLIVGQDSSMVEWGPLLPARLSEHFRVTMFDNRGVGYTTDQPDRPLTIDLMADDTARLLDVLGIRKATVVGWSTGGEIGLALAVRHPDKIHALILSGATAGGPTAIQPGRKIEATFRSRSPSSLDALLGSLFPASARTAALAYLTGLLALPPETISHRTAHRQEQAEISFGRTNEVYDALPRISAPVLVTNGGLDELVPPANARLIAGRIPHSRLVIFADAAHMMMFQDLDRFAILATRFASAAR